MESRHHLLQRRLDNRLKDIRLSLQWDGNLKRRLHVVFHCFKICFVNGLSFSSQGVAFPLPFGSHQKEDENTLATGEGNQFQESK
ncbi:hypothetical protein F2Q69_00062391 [Brassica cretica]|uniref:Uncharacterized protein n=1 Tax=Brassica cretica TaxID=69181 RepID=A0A8S9RI98_BRACR|nr:hypothetical protein F2Q69_00062391 [Brassica cretica]